MRRREYWGQSVHPSQTVKVLGVPLNFQLKMDEQVAVVTSSAIVKCTALRKIRGVRPMHMRQLHRAVVVLVNHHRVRRFDPGASSRNGTNRLVNQLERVQQVASRPLPKVCALPSDRPLQGCVTLFRVRSLAFSSPFRST